MIQPGGTGGKAENPIGNNEKKGPWPSQIPFLY